MPTGVRLGATRPPISEARLNASPLYLADLTPEEAAAGFAVRPVAHPDGGPAVVPAAVLVWADPSHRVVKTSGRDGPVFQLQAFGRHPRGPAAPAWYAERYWPARYGIAWVLDRLWEYLGRPGYRPLIPLVVPPAGSPPAAAPDGLVPAA